MHDGVRMQQAVVQALHHPEAAIPGVQNPRAEGHGWVVLVDFAEDLHASIGC